MRGREGPSVALITPDEEVHDLGDIPAALVGERPDALGSSWPGNTTSGHWWSSDGVSPIPARYGRKTRCDPSTSVRPSARDGAASRFGVWRSLAVALLGFLVVTLVAFHAR